MVQETDPIVAVFTRTGVGTYRATITGAFPTAGKVPNIDGTINGLTGTRYNIARIDANTIEIKSVIADGTLTDGLFTGKTLEVKVWD